MFLSFLTSVHVAGFLLINKLYTSAYYISSVFAGAPVFSSHTRARTKDHGDLAFIATKQRCLTSCGLETGQPSEGDLFRMEEIVGFHEMVLLRAHF